MKEWMNGFVEEQKVQSVLSLVKHDLPVFLRSYLTNWLYETVNHFFIIDIGVKQSLFAFLISNYVLTLFSGNFHRFIDIWDEQPRFAGNDSNFKRRPECKNWSARKRRRTAVKLWRVKEKGILKLSWRQKKINYIDTNLMPFIQHKLNSS